jgi:hypothetical protein
MPHIGTKWSQRLPSGAVSLPVRPHRGPKEKGQTQREKNRKLEFSHNAGTMH